MSILTAPLITILLTNICSNTLVITRTLTNLITTYSSNRIFLAISQSTIVGFYTFWAECSIILTISIFITLKCCSSYRELWLTLIFCSWSLKNANIVALIITLKDALATVSFWSCTLWIHTNSRFTSIIQITVPTHIIFINTSLILRIVVLTLRLVTNTYRLGYTSPIIANICCIIRWALIISLTLRIALCFKCAHFCRSVAVLSNWIWFTVSILFTFLACALLLLWVIT